MRREWDKRRYKIERMIDSTKRYPQRWRFRGIAFFVIGLLIVLSLAIALLDASHGNGWFHLALNETPAVLHRVHSGIRQSILSETLDDLRIVDTKEIQEINDRINSLSLSDQPIEILRWANSKFHGRWAQITSFGLSGLAISHMVRQTEGMVDIPMITIDTLHLFPETYAFIEESKRSMDLQNLHVYRTKYAATKEEFEANFGPKLWKVDPSLFDFITKLEPLQRALEDLKIDAWVTGRRRSQGGERSGMRLVEVDGADKRVKINPLANWPLEKVEEYLREAGVVHNPLVDRGYGSVGDTVSSRPVAPNQPERAAFAVGKGLMRLGNKKGDAGREGTGRWAGQNRTECGMHLSNRLADRAGLEQRRERVQEAYTWERSAQKRATSLGILQVTEDNFKETVILGLPGRWVLLEAYAPWCPHCRHLEPTFNQLPAALAAAAALPGGAWAAAVSLARVDAWQNRFPPPYDRGYEVAFFPSLFLASPTNRSWPLRPGADADTHSVAGLVAWLRSAASAA